MLIKNLVLCKRSFPAWALIDFIRNTATSMKEKEEL